jgi:hypothetical protein
MGGILGKIGGFFWERKKLWLIPLVAMAVLLVVLQLSQSPAFAPIIYAFF